MNDQLFGVICFLLAVFFGREAVSEKAPEPFRRTAAVLMGALLIIPWLSAILNALP